MIASNTPPKRGRPRTPDILVPMPALGTKARYALSEAAHLLGMSVSLLYERIASGAIEATRDGRRRYITDAEVRRYGQESH